MPDGGAGLLLQRDLLHLRAGADAISTACRPTASAGTSCPSPLGNFLGPLLLGPLFDTLGRKPMIAATYATVRRAAGASPASSFAQGVLTAATQTIAWTIVFFFASAAASSAYLTVSETFPLEMRAWPSRSSTRSAPALGGVAGPWLFGALIETGSRGERLLRLSDRRGADAGCRGRAAHLGRGRGAQAAGVRRRPLTLAE